MFPDYEITGSAGMEGGRISDGWDNPLLRYAACGAQLEAVFGGRGYDHPVVPCFKGSDLGPSGRTR